MGFFKKIVVANNIKIIADKIFALQEPSKILLDFAGDDRLTADLFFDSIHPNEEGRLIFTRIVAEGLSPILEQQSP